MDPRLLFSLFMLTSICMALTTKADDIKVSTRDVGYEYTMTTNHIEATSRKPMEINLDIQGYDPD